MPVFWHIFSKSNIKYFLRLHPNHWWTSTAYMFERVASWAFPESQGCLRRVKMHVECKHALKVRKLFEMLCLLKRYAVWRNGMFWTQPSMYGMIFTYNLVDIYLDFFLINIPIPAPWDVMGFVFMIFSVKKMPFSSFAAWNAHRTWLGWRALTQDLLGQTSCKDGKSDLLGGRGRGAGPNITKN